jgi:ParB family chromosome partitioning protein
MTIEKRKALGRGLAALIPSAPVAAPAAAAAPTALRDYFVCPIEDIHPSGANPRQRFDEPGMVELIDSVREHGVIEPLVVRPRAGGGYAIIAGERRWRAAQKAGRREVPVVVREATDTEAYELALVENLQRRDLNPIEEAEGYRRLCDDHGYTHEKLALRVGKDRTTIVNALRLLKLPPPVRALVVEGRLAAGHARALLGLGDGERDGTAIARAAEEVVGKGLSTRETEALVRRLRAAREPAKGPAPAPAPAKSAAVRDLEARLARSLGVEVKVHDVGGGAGRLEILYPTLDDLDRVLDKLLRP